MWVWWWGMVWWEWLWCEWWCEWWCEREWEGVCCCCWGVRLAGAVVALLCWESDARDDAARDKPVPFVPIHAGRER